MLDKSRRISFKFRIRFFLYGISILAKSGYRQTSSSAYFVMRGHLKSSNTGSNTFLKIILPRKI